MNAQLEITRRPHAIGWARGARILVDGSEVASIGAGKTATLEIPPGKHVVTAALVGCSSAANTIEFAPGETVRLDCKLKMGLFSNTFQLRSADGRLLTGTPVVAKHHGTMLLILGILGFFLGILGLAALVQGIADLNKMSRGEMDRSGELQTWIGLILGAIGFLINLLFLIATLGVGHR